MGTPGNWQAEFEVEQSRDKNCKGNSKEKFESRKMDRGRRIERVDERCGAEEAEKQMMKQFSSACRCFDKLIKVL